jgi:hypothetical protein
VNESELGRALLNLESTAPPSANPRELTRRIVNRDRRRVRILAGMATFFWVLTAAGIVAVCPFYVMFIAPRLRAYKLGGAQLDQDWNDWATAGEWAAWWLTACILSLLAAAICTVLLTLVTRRATLRQINASLLEISEHLKQLRPAPLGDTPA